jgi:arogenate dehydrogenase (NADP+)
MKKVSIIGFGRFGKVLYRLMKKDFELIIFDKKKQAYEGIDLGKKHRIARNILELYQSQTIFYAVPIDCFENVISKHRKYFKNHVLIDVLSVKKHPARVFKKYLKGSKGQAILTHPMFGPDSSKCGFDGLPIVLDKFMASAKEYAFWKKYFSKKGLKVVEMSAKEHDRLAANSQGITHFIGRLLAESKFGPTSIDTLGAKNLQEVIEQTCNDTWQLFLNLQNYNPYTKQMRIRLGKAYDKLYNRLLPQRVSLGHIVYGIQGGVGSFNEEAIFQYTDKNRIKNYKIKYLYTTKKVLRELHKGNIDFGLFAIHNSVGGMVEESIKAMASYKFRVIEEFDILVRHFLMKRKDAGTKKIKTIMAHPQVFKQCQATLKKKYPKMLLKSGRGDLIDTAEVAKLLSKKRLPPNTAILGPKNLSKLYNLEIIDKDLQDNKINYTSFLLVGR